MKLRQNLFLKKFLPVWGIVGVVFSLVFAVVFEIEGIYDLLMMFGINVSCALLSATIGWKCCLTHHWFNLSLNMLVAFWIVVTIYALIRVGSNVIWGIVWIMFLLPLFILLCCLPILVVNYLMLRKQLS